MKATKIDVKRRVTAARDRLHLPFGAVFFRLPQALKEFGVGFQHEDQAQEIGEEQHHRHCQINILLVLDGVGGDKVVERTGNGQADDRQQHHGHVIPSGCRVELLDMALQPSGKKGRPQAQEHIGQNSADNGRFDHVIEPGLEGHQGNDQLRGVAEGGVQESPDGIPGVGGQLFGGVHQQRRQWENGHCGQKKQQGLRYTPDPVEDDGQGDEDQGQPIKYFLQDFQRIPFSPDTSAGASAPSPRMRWALAFFKAERNSAYSLPFQV